MNIKTIPIHGGSGVLHAWSAVIILFEAGYVSMPTKLFTAAARHTSTLDLEHRPLRSAPMSSQEWIGGIAATFTTCSFIPQVWKVWHTRHTQDISLLMYSFFTVGVTL